MDFGSKDIELGSRIAGQRGERGGYMEHCAADDGGLKSLLEADKPGRSFNAAARENCDKVEWYPAVADLAVSGDLGFTTGPWVCTLAGNGRIQGHYLTLWKRDAGCDWPTDLAIPAPGRQLGPPSSVNQLAIAVDVEMNPRRSTIARRITPIKET